MAGSIQEAAKAVTPSPKQRRVRKVVDDEEWAKELREEERQKRQKTAKRRRRKLSIEEEKEEEKEEEEEEEEKEENVVEKITGQAVDEATGQVYFHVKWAGYSYGQSTWEPLTGLTNCLDVLNDYLAAKYQKDSTIPRVTIPK
jgi:type II secretory ATPase GspE/PulE/Tfp pilus assembly ATPase PilB-like protein